MLEITGKLCLFSVTCFLTCPPLDMTHVRCKINRSVCTALFFSYLHVCMSALTLHDTTIVFLLLRYHISHVTLSLPLFPWQDFRVKAIPRLEVTMKVLLAVAAI